MVPIYLPYQSLILVPCSLCSCSLPQLKEALNNERYLFTLDVVNAYLVNINHVPHLHKIAFFAIPKHFVFSDKKLPLFSFPKGSFIIKNYRQIQDGVSCRNFEAVGPRVLKYCGPVPWNRSQRIHTAYYNQCIIGPISHSHGNNSYNRNHSIIL